MNVSTDDNGQHTLRLDLAAVREMLADYYARDLWQVAFDTALPGDLHVVIDVNDVAASGVRILECGGRRRRCVRDLRLRGARDEQSRERGRDCDAQVARTSGHP